MATVVRGFPDLRAAELGAGVAKFLEAKKEKRKQKLMQEMMIEISNSSDEAEAAAIFGDPKFGLVVSDTESFSTMVQHLNNVPLGTDSIAAYDRDGNKILVPFRKGTDPMQALIDSEATLERDRSFALINPNDREGIPISIPGRFANAREAFASLPEGSVSEEMQAVDIEQATKSLQFAAASIGARQREDELLLGKRRLELAENDPLTAGGDIIKDYADGRYGPVGSLEAIKLRDDMLRALTSVVGRTGEDAAEETKVPLAEEGAAIQAMSRGGRQLIEEALKNPDMLTFVGGVPAFFNAIEAELESVGRLFGIPTKPIEDYDFGSFSGARRSFKSMLLSFGVLFAASEGQRGRALSNEEFTRFLKAVGKNINDAEVFAQNLMGLMAFKQDNFDSKHRSLQNGLSWEQASGQKWIRFDPNKEDRDEATRVSIEQQWNIKLRRPPNR